MTLTSLMTESMYEAQLMRLESQMRLDNVGVWIMTMCILHLNYS